MDAIYNAALKDAIKTRDYYMVMIINGVTKAGVHQDKKKEKKRKECRKKVDTRREEW